MTKRIAVIGGGAAGLSCAATLSGAGLHVDCFEATDRIGGRMVTDHLEGFTLDQGFQVILTGYPNIRRLLDLPGLDLRYFHTGTQIFDGERVQWLMDPLDGSLTSVFETLKANLPTWSDKAQLTRLKMHLTRTRVLDLINGPVETTRQGLQNRWGFSERLIERFFSPFLGTFLLDPNLSARAAVSLMAMRSFFKGRMAIPAHGIQAISEQLASHVPHIQLNAPITDLPAIQAAYDAVVIATDAGSAITLLDQVGKHLPGLTSRVHQGVSLYFAARQSPLDEAVVMTNGVAERLVATLAVPSMIAPYAPTGWQLIALNILTDLDGAPVDDLVEPALADARRMVGDQVDDWRFLRGYQVQKPDTSVMGSSEVKVDEHLYVCGDHREVGGLEAALYSGQQAADGILRGLA